jgi:hypothetical protein
MSDALATSRRPEILDRFAFRMLEALPSDEERERVLGEFEREATAPKPVRRRQRKPTLANALKQAAKAGVPVKSAVVGAEGVTLQFGKSEQATDLNDWDEVLPGEPH